MKRSVIQVSLVFLFSLLLTFGVHAAGTYHLDDLGMSIDIPMGYQVVTRNMTEDDPALEQFSMSREEITKALEDNNIYLDLLNEDNAFEYIVTMTPNDARSLDQFNKASLENMKDTIVEEYADLGLSVEKIELCTVGKTIYYRIRGSTYESGYPMQVLHYYTVHNYQSINLSLHYEGEEIPEAYEQLSKELINSVRFDGEEVPAPTEPFEFTDSETGVRFVVPAGWIEVKENQNLPAEDRQKAVKASFYCAKDPNLAIVYACTDVMEQMPDLFQKIADRSMINMEAVSLDDLKEALPYEVHSAVTQNIAGRDFYVLEISGTANVDGKDVDFTETDVIRIENGYEYAFQFGGTSDNPRYQEFLTLVENAEFPKVEAPKAEAVPEETEAAPAETPQTAPVPEEADIAEPAPAPAASHSGSTGLLLLPILLGLITVGAIVGIAARGKKPNRPDQAAPEVPEPRTGPAKRVCAACGAELSPTDQTCPLCGAKTE